MIDEKMYESIWQAYENGYVDWSVWQSLLYSNNDFRDWVTNKETTSVMGSGEQGHVEWVAEQNIRLYRRYIRSGLFTQSQVVELVATHGYRLSDDV